MEVPEDVGSDENVGHSIKGSGLKSALDYGRIFGTLLSHVRARGEMSVDRLSLAEHNGDMDTVVRAAEWRTRKEANQDFQGWAVVKVADLHRRCCRVESDKIVDDDEMPDDEYHANVLLPDHVKNKRGEVEQFVRELMKVVGWKPRPESESGI